MENNNEIWKDIPGYEGLYQVSNMGQVKSLGNGGTHKNVKILKPGMTSKGYLNVVLWKNGKKKNHLVHRLVAEAFVPNDEPKHKTQCNHISENKLDCRAINLNWMSSKENANWGTRNKRIMKKQSTPIVQKLPDGTVVKVWSSQNEAGRNGYIQQQINRCCNGKRKTHRGYLWAYLN